MTTTTSGIVQAYHFVGSTLRDGRPVPPDGVWLVHDGPVELCVSGLHASRRPWHALAYAPGSVLCVVEVADIVEEASDKLVARRRRIVRRVDLAPDLWAFARQCARDVLHLWDAPDVVRRYLETGDEALREAARDAAWVTAEEAAWADAWAAESAARSARAAARSAAWAAAWDAARDAASAARAAARDDARADAWVAQGARFDAMCRSRLEDR